MNTKEMTRKYTLKPGKHQFAPGSHAVHDNDNLSDEDAEWYLQHYPHIAALFEERITSENSESTEINETIPGEQSPEGDGFLNQ